MGGGFGVSEVDCSTAVVSGAPLPPACAKTTLTGPTPYTHHVVRTPLARSETLSAVTGAEVWVKFENLQFTASYKERGALNRLTETGALIAAAAAACYPIIHLGRPWFFYWNLPYPNTFLLWPQFRSPL